jgi:hypothetical protein
VVFCHVAQSNQSMVAAQTNAKSDRFRSEEAFPRGTVAAPWSLFP